MDDLFAMAIILQQVVSPLHEYFSPAMPHCVKIIHSDPSREKQTQFRISGWRLNLPRTKVNDCEYLRANLLS
jgi:hypothetical protein